MMGHNFSKVNDIHKYFTKPGRIIGFTIIRQILHLPTPLCIDTLLDIAPIKSGSSCLASLSHFNASSIQKVSVLVSVGDGFCILCPS